LKNQHRKSPIEGLVRKRQVGCIASFERDPRISNRLSCGFQIDFGKIDADYTFYTNELGQDSGEASGSAANIKNTIAIGDT
jgi:uncharacterized protein (UPF0128 family)